MEEIAKTEKEMRETDDKWPKSYKELKEYISSLVNREHDYGTCVYAVSLASVATFNFMAGQLGITGFQASMADLDILRRTRNLKQGFRILNYENLLFPQYLTREHFPTQDDLLEENKEELSKEAKRLLAERDGDVHPEVKARWEYVASLVDTRL